MVMPTAIQVAIGGTMPWENFRRKRNPRRGMGDELVESSLAHDGCEVSPGRLGCLSCPLPACRYDDPTFYDRWKEDAGRRERRVLYERVTKGGESPYQVGFQSRARWARFLTQIAADEEAEAAATVTAMKKNKPTNDDVKDKRTL